MGMHGDVHGMGKKKNVLLRFCTVQMTQTCRRPAEKEHARELQTCFGPVMMHASYSVLFGTEFRTPLLFESNPYHSLLPVER